MNPKIATRRVSLLLLLFTLCAVTALAQTTSFTYQGRLTDGGTPANANYDLQFTVWDALSGGTQQPQPSPVTVARNAVAVANGIFTVQLDFGANAFPGADRFLEISARPSGVGSFTTLAPRQPITSTPYAIRSAAAGNADTATNATNATTATNATQLGGVAASQYVQTNDSRLTDSRPPTPGSVNYIQNTTTPQAGANFNISGNGTAGGALSAAQYNIGGTRVLAFDVNSNDSFVGVAAGDNTTGVNNTFVGAYSGSFTTSGSRNSFFGFLAGYVNKGGSDNTLIGADTNVGSGALTNATAIGAKAYVEQSNSLVLGSVFPSVNVGIGTTKPQARLDVNGTALFQAGNVGIGTTTPQAKLHVQTNGSDNIQLGTPGGETGMAIIKGTSSRADVRFDGSTLKLVAIAGGGVPPATSGLAINLTGSVGIGTTSPVRLLDVAGRARVQAIPLEPSVATVCFNNVGDLLNCGASSLRWKTNVRPFLGGLEIIRRLRPINFNWKESGLPDIGLGAEDVAKVAPSLTFVNSKGEAEGVKYERLNIVLINAVKEQQQQIEQQQKQIATLLTSNAALNARLRGVEKSLRKKASSRKARR